MADRGGQVENGGQRRVVGNLPAARFDGKFVCNFKVIKLIQLDEIINVDRSSHKITVTLVIYIYIYIYETRIL
jgi:hypothetical protein